MKKIQEIRPSNRALFYGLCFVLFTCFIYLSMATEPNKFVTMSPYCPANRT